MVINDVFIEQIRVEFLFFPKTELIFDEAHV